MWSQIYDPFGNFALSTIVAAIPAVFLLGLIATGRLQIHIAAVVALIVAFVIAVVGFTMPFDMALRATALGALTGFFPIGWIILNVIFLYRLSVERGWFAIMQQSIGDITPDRRLQLLLIAFAFGAFFEGASGFGTPVAVTGAILMGLGFSPLAAAGLSLIANTAPVAYGALGTPIVGLQAATGLDGFLLGAMVGRQLPVFSVIVPFWLIWAFAGWRATKEIWPAALVCGLSFGVTQFLISNYITYTLAAIGAAMVCLICLRAFLYVWQPATIWTSTALRVRDDSAATMPAAQTDGPEGEHGGGRQGLDAVGDSRPHPRPLGCTRREGCTQRPLRAGLPDRRIAPVGSARAARRRRARTRGRRVHLHLLLLQRHGNSGDRDHLGLPDGLLRQTHGTGLHPDDRRGEIFADHDRRDARARISHALCGRRCHARACLRRDGHLLSVLRLDARMARRCVDRVRHRLERAVRRTAAHHRRAARAFALS